MKNTFWLLNIHRTILAESKDTDGHYDLVEGVTERGITTPPHVHTKYTETLYVLEGELTIYMESGIQILAPGDCYTIQKGQAHKLRATGIRKTKTLTLFSPSGFADVIRQAGIAGGLNDYPEVVADMELFEKLSGEIGDMTLVGGNSQL